MWARCPLASIGFNQWEVLAGECEVRRRKRSEYFIPLLRPWFGAGLKWLHPLWLLLQSHQAPCTAPRLSMLHTRPLEPSGANGSQLLLGPGCLHGTCWFPCLSPHSSISCQSQVPCLSLPWSNLVSPRKQTLPLGRHRWSLLELASSEKYNSSFFFDS